MKLWVDDVRPAPDGYEWLRSVGDAVIAICYVEKSGDYIKLLEWFEQIR